MIDHDDDDDDGIDYGIVTPLFVNLRNWQKQA